MSDRWNHRTVVVDNVKPVRVFMNGDGKTREYAGLEWRYTRYRCPDHGVWIRLGEHTELEAKCMSVVDNPRVGIGMGFCCKASALVPPDPEPAPTTSEHPAGFKVRVRGAGGTVVHAYRCPVHGLFDARVERADVPDEVACPTKEEIGPFTGSSPWTERRCFATCGLTSPWAGSFAGQGIAAGEVTC